MIPSGYIADWLSGGAWAAFANGPPYSSIIRGLCATYDGLVLINGSERPTLSGGSAAGDNEAGSGITETWSGSPTFGVAGSNGYGVTVAATDSLVSSGVATTFGQTGSWVVTFMPTAWPSSGNSASIAGLVVFTHPSTFKNDRILWFGHDGTLNFTLQNSGSTYTTISSSPGVLSLNLWHEIIVIWTTSNVYLYVDQTLVASASVTPLNITGGASDSCSMFLGNASNASAYVGVAGTYDLVAYFGSPLPHANEGSNGDFGATAYAIFSGGLTSGIGVSHSVSATSSFVVTTIGTGLDGKNWSVSASSAVTLTPASAVSGLNHSYSMSAATSFVWNQSGSAVLHVPAIYTVSGTTSFSLTSHPTVLRNTSYLVSASSGFVLGTLSRGHVPAIYLVAAATTIYIGGLATEDSTTHFVSAATAFVLADMSSKSKCGSVYLTAASGINLSQLVLITHPGPRYVSAASGMNFADQGSETKFGPVYLTAASGFTLGQLTAISNPGPRPVSASTQVTLSTKAIEIRDAVLAASTGFVVASSGRKNRDIAVGATTSFVAISNPQTSNIKSVSAASGVHLVSAATSVLGATEAANGIVMLDLATAVVWLPWRRASLSLPDGGNLPHS